MITLGSLFDGSGGFPDWWCSDIPHKDAPEYKMWGNGVALPCVLYVMEGLAEALREV